MMAGEDNDRPNRFPWLHAPACDSEMKDLLHLHMCLPQNQPKKMPLLKLAALILASMHGKVRLIESKDAVLFLLVANSTC